MSEVTRGLGFEVVRRPAGIDGGQWREWVQDSAGRLRPASVEESRLWAALLAAQARVVELEAERDAAEEHDTRRKKR